MAVEIETNEAFENRKDETQILSDQDSTLDNNLREFDENMGAKSASLDDLEKESPDFMRGEIDVKEQMDRTSEVMANSIQGIQEVVDDKDEDSELIASFKATPGGLDEVIMKTDEFLATHPEVLKQSDENESQTH